MPKIKDKNQKHNQNMEEMVMQKIEKGNIKMKPKWIFIAGSILTIAGIIASVFTSTFLVNLIIFLIKKQGSGIGKLNMILTSFPIWIPIVAFLGIMSGILLLRKYDFSYKKNFALIIAAFVISVILAGFLMDKSGVNDIWSKRGMIKGVYQGIEKPDGLKPGYFQGQSGQRGIINGYNKNR